MAKGNSDLELLIKMMGQTTNDNDNIVLVSIRKANEQVKKLTGGGWAELLHGHFTIAADPFEGLSDPLAYSEFRRGVSPAPPPPQPAPRAAPPPPQRPQPANPGPSSSAAGPMGNQSQQSAPRINRFRAVCYKCNHYCQPGEGYLDGKNPITNDWKVKCNNTHRCNSNQAKGARAQKSNPARGSIDNIFNMVD
jgi:hypothetical protein